ncbi:S8 family serine peptidase [Bacillus sp. EB106-08-02-XG196]|uniref:S8 family serine peptidase n=1 Tax=Bacillus sp. EB106-08-02-XG196 TaxID=2737049 RepID=UPI0015C474AF|nr:S8 family serine peptidase [Bacillus sp. EB106-08-02-XG196]NWQ43373.1 S8 family serine peptidase [Bacillus sp. EB106-08-02-XG196]
MKERKYRWYSKTSKTSTAIALSLGLLFLSVQFGNGHVSGATGKSAEQILASLTPEQQAALNQLEMTENYGLQGFSDEDLKSDKDISVIVQFKSKPGKVAVLEAALKGKKVTKHEANEQVDQEHSTFQSDLEKILPAATSSSEVKSAEPSYKITRSYKTSYNGVALTLAANQVEALMKSEVVQSVHKNITFTVEPPSIAQEESNNASTQSASVPFVGVDKLHAEGITGKGVKVGVIDSGVDYNHPDLKDAFKGGYDFVDNDNDPMETTYADWKKSVDPEFNSGISYYTEHGTHVSGIIVGQAKNDSEVSVKGVAPDADLYVYRVLGPYGSGTSEAVLAGIDRAVADGMDVINLSLGAGINDPYFPTSTAVNYAVLSDVTAVVAAGNSGLNSYTLGSPGTAALALTVGASDVSISNSSMKGAIGTLSGLELRNMAKSFTDNLSTLEGKSLDLVDVGLGGNANYTGKDVNGKIAFVARGTYAFTDKVKFAKQHGAAAVLMYNNVPGHIPTYLGEDQNFIPTFSLTQEDGLKVNEQLTAGNKSFTFSNLTVTKTQGDTLADFSSRGPAKRTYDIKPEVTAPGVSVMSSVPAYIGNHDAPTDYKYAYARFSGTSMATPNAAGVAALLLQVNPTLQPEDVKTIMMNTADPLNGSYSVFEVGAGRVDPYQAVHTGMKIQVQDTTLVPNADVITTIKEKTGGIAFGTHYAGEDLSVTKKLKFQNLTDKVKNFNLNVQFQAVKGSLDAVANQVQVKFHPTLTVDPASTESLHVTIEVPKAAAEGIYEGYLLVTNQEDQTEQYRIPFSVRTAEDNFKTLDIGDSNIFSPAYYRYDHYGKFNTHSLVYALMNLKTPMKTMDMILVDWKSGQELGFVGRHNLVGKNIDTNYALVLFNGNYYPFTVDGISTETVQAKPGQYQLKTITTTEADKVLTKSFDLLVDIDLPTFTSSLDQESPILEYKPGQTTYPFEVQIYDKEIEAAKQAGMAVDQSKNWLEWYRNSPLPHPVRMDTAGKWKEEILMDEKTPVLSFKMDGFDGGGNIGGMKAYYFVKEGTPFAYGTSKQKSIALGETITTTLTLDNVQKLKSATWNLLDYDYYVPKFGTQLEVVEAKPNAALSEFGEGTVTVTYTNGKPSIKLDVASTKEVSGKIPAVDVTIRVKDTAYTTVAGFNANVSYVNEAGTSTNLFFAPFSWNVTPTFSEAFGYLTAEGFRKYVSGQVIVWGKKDWVQAGAKVIFSDAMGKVYDATINSRFQPEFLVTKLPLTDQLFTKEVHLPGHFITIQKNQKVGFLRNGVWYGQNMYIDNKEAVAGDVNQDQVIDIYDALAIQEAWGTNKREADINFDGIVNATDIGFVKTNYLKVNPDVENTPKPADNVKSKRLDDILRELGVTP